MGEVSQRNTTIRSFTPEGQKQLPGDTKSRLRPKVKLGIKAKRKGSRATDQQDERKRSPSFRRAKGLLSCLMKKDATR